MRSFALAAVAVTFLVAPCRADDDDAPSLDDIPHITMVGTAHAEVRPDLATITIGVTTEQPTAKAAAAEVARRATAVIGAAKAAGVPDIDIATQTVTLTQTFDPIKDANGHETGRRPRGFAAETTVAIKMRDFDKAGVLATDLVAKGADRLYGVEFSVEHPEPIADKLVGAAVKNARTQAEIATEAAGVHLGRVLLIKSPGADQTQVFRFAGGQTFGAAPASIPLLPRPTRLSASATVTWAIEPR